MRKSSFPVDVSITLFDYTFPLDVKGICDKFYEPALILSGAPKYESGQTTHRCWARCWARKEISRWPSCAQLTLVFAEPVSCAPLCTGSCEFRRRGQAGLDPKRRSPCLSGEHR